MSRRSNYLQGDATYAAVGASGDPHVVKFPPEGFEGYEDAVLIGMGERIFRQAADQLMSWEAQRNAGIRVHDVSLGKDASYLGLERDLEGQPTRARSSDEIAYSASGEEMIQAGMTATLEWRYRRAHRRVRVVFTVDEPKRVGFAIGSLDTNGVVGEEFFWVDYRPDNTVWVSVRGFLSAPDAGWLGLKRITLMRLARLSSRAQLHALLRPRTAL